MEPVVSRRNGLNIKITIRFEFNFSTSFLGRK